MIFGSSIDHTCIEEMKEIPCRPRPCINHNPTFLSQVQIHTRNATMLIGATMNGNLNRFCKVKLSQYTCTRLVRVYHLSFVFILYSVRQKTQCSGYECESSGEGSINRIGHIPSSLGQLLQVHVPF